MSRGEAGALHNLTDDQWTRLLQFADRAQLTLPLAWRTEELLPKRIRTRFDRNLANNAERWERTKKAYGEAAAAFRAAELQFVVLKGFTQCPEFVPDPRLRAQYDLDLLFAEAEVGKALEIVSGLGYEPIRSSRVLPVDHLPTMIRKTGWEWRGDYFDPELPLAVELHFRLWDETTERIAVPGLDCFATRRRMRELDGICFAAFDSADALGYACLHLMRHLLRGDVRPSHVHELAWFLEHKAEDAAFWAGWRELHEDRLRRLEAVCFGVARSWFDCRLGDVAAVEIERLPAAVRQWLQTFSLSPLTTMFRPNKDELWLHLALLDSTQSKASVLARRLLPLSIPGPVDAVHVPEGDVTVRIRSRRAWRYGVFVASRVMHHVRVLPGFLLGPLDTPFWRFFAAAACYNLGLFLFFMLYNLYLLQIGFKEHFLGLVSSAMLAGSMCGSVPAALAIRRFGLRKVLQVGFVLTACLSAARVLFVFPAALLALAFAGGLSGSIWATALPPSVAGLTSESRRPLGFSVIFSSGIAVGILGGIVAGWLPGWLSLLHVDAPMRAALLIGCGSALVGLLPLGGLHFGDSPSTARGIHRPSSRLLRFLLAGALWNLGTGAFNPFFNAYFASLHMPVERIGLVFSASQFGQAVAVLLAPLALRRFSLVGGISLSQIAASGGLLFLAAVASPTAAAFGYCGYMLLQFITEPSMYTLLMDCAPKSERSSASALNFLVASSAQALAAASGGWMVELFGYPPVLATAALVCAMSGVLFRILLRSSNVDTQRA